MHAKHLLRTVGEICERQHVASLWYTHPRADAQSGLQAAMERIVDESLAPLRDSMQKLQDSWMSQHT